MRYSDVLMEGGNVFKDSLNQSTTRPIHKKEIGPTVAWLEKITGLSLAGNLLGSTGKKARSGDIDLAVDFDHKEQLLERLRAQSPDIRASGINVHFKCPVSGNPQLGFVQVDFAIGDPEWLKFTLFSAGDASRFSGSDRNILIASIASSHGWKMSPKLGLMARGEAKLLTKIPDNIAFRLVGVNDQHCLDSVETIISTLRQKGVSGEEMHRQIFDCIDNFRQVQGDDARASMLEKLAGLE